MLAREVPLVEGTTGWKQHESQARKIVDEHNGAIVYGANFSIGVNLFYRLTEHAAKLFAAVEGYEPFIEEAHHNRKRDAPSGTALKLRDIMSEHVEGDISTSSTRAVTFQAHIELVSIPKPDPGAAHAHRAFATGVRERRFARRALDSWTNRECLSLAK